MKTWEAVAEYYGSEAVRARIAEYCGGRPGLTARFAAAGLAGYGGRTGLHASDMAPVVLQCRDFGRLLDDGADICRAFADRGGTLIQLDLDYVHPRDPGEVYRDPWTCFRALEPVYQAARDVFRAYDLPVLAMITGRGYHFTARAASGGALASDLVALSRLGPPSLAPPGAVPRSASRTVSMDAAHDGAGRLVEFICHAVARAVVGRTVVPVTLADVPPPGRGPFICLDSTAYGDTLSSRHARCAFSSHQKASVEGLVPANDPGFVIALPRETLGLSRLLSLRADAAAAARQAETMRADLPDVHDAPRLVRAYRDSALAASHRRFDAEAGPGPPAAARRYAAIEPSALPLCVRGPLENPNPALLVPQALRAVTLTLRGRGWRPRAIADLVRSRYEGTHAWGDLWRRFDPAPRAEFYVRLFVDAWDVGLDGPDAFTCAIERQRGGCPGGRCGHELEDLCPPAEGFAR